MLYDNMATAFVRLFIADGAETNKTCTVHNTRTHALHTHPQMNKNRNMYVLCMCDTIDVVMVAWALTASLRCIYLSFKYAQKHLSFSSERTKLNPRHFSMVS